MSRCTYRVLLQHYCMPSSIGLALDICLTIKRLFYATSFFRLACLLTEQFTCKFRTFFPSLPPFGDIFVVTQIKCGSPLVSTIDQLSLPAT